MNTKIKMCLFGVISLLLLVAGCTALTNQFVGSTVSKAPVHKMQPGGPHADFWQTFDLNVEYEYRQTDDVFEISGSAYLSQHYDVMYSYLHDLKIYLFLLDDNGRVLASSLLARDLSGRILEKLPFRQTLKIPPAAVALSFGYDGQVSEGKDFSSFYLLPLNK